MKSNDIDKIINETISNEIRDRILKEQVQYNDAKSFIKSLNSLAPFTEKAESRDNSLINIKNITPEELMSCCSSQSVEDAIKILNKNLYNDLTKCGMGDCDLDIDLNSNGGDSIDLFIKIIPNKELGNEISEEMKTGNMGEFLECLTRAKQNNEETFNIGGNEYNVQEWYSQLEEELGDEECSECGQQSMEEQEFEDTPKNTGKSEYGKKETEMTKIFKESELAGVNEPENIIDMEGDYVNENKKTKKVIKLTESKFIEMIGRILKEVSKPKMIGKEVKVSGKGKPFGIKGEPKESEINLPKNVPGLQAVKKAHEGDKRDSDEYINSVDKKMRDYLSFNGNDNPEFPNQIGGDKVAHKIEATEQQDYIDTYRGMGPQDALYDTPPSKAFIERVKKALSGDSTMGNKQDNKTANVAPSKVGEKVHDNAKKKRDNIKNDPMYVKDSQPTDEVEKTKRAMAGDMRFVAEEDTEKQKVIEEEIQRMKQISSYSKKTQ